MSKIRRIVDQVYGIDVVEKRDISGSSATEGSYSHVYRASRTVIHRAD